MFLLLFPFYFTYKVAYHTHCFILCFSFNNSSRRSFIQLHNWSESGKPGAQQIRRFYQHWLPGVREPLGSCQLSEQPPCLHTQRPATSQKLCLSPEKGPTKRSNQLDWSNLLSLHMTKQDKRVGVLFKVRPWSGKELEISGHLPAGPKFSHLYHVFFGTGHYLQSKLQIPVFNTGPSLEGSRVWCGGRHESTSHRVRKSGFQSWALFGLPFPHLEKGAWTMLSNVSSEKSPESWISSF